MVRIRVQRGPAVVGGFKYNAALGLTFQQGQWVAEKYTNTCEDTIGNKHDPNQLAITKVKYDVTPLNGTVSGNIWNNWYPTGMKIIPGHMSTTAPSVADATNKLMARTNPGRADISVPRAVAELRELPAMVKQGGDIYRTYLRSGRTPRDLRRANDRWRNMQDTAGLYLGYNFGIAPILSDLRKLLAFQGNVKRRVDELNRLFNKGGLKRRLQLGSYNNSDSSIVTIESGPGAFGARRTRTTNCKMWGTIKWQPISGASLPPATPAGMYSMAQRAVLGFGRPGGGFDNNPNSIGMDPGDYYDIIPWTWLGNWFADVGTYLHAKNNRIPSTPGRMCIMIHTVTKYDWSRTDFPQVQGGTGSTERVTKERYVTTSAQLPTAHIPFLSPWRLSIAGSLAATRFRGLGR